MYETLLDYRIQTAERGLDPYALKGNDIWLAVNSLLVLAGHDSALSGELQEQLIHDENLKSRLLFPEQTENISQLVDQLGGRSKKTSTPLTIYTPTAFEEAFFSKHFQKLAVKLLKPLPAATIKKMLLNQDANLFITALRSVVIAEVAPLAH